MPICKKCGVMQATVEMRRSPKKGNAGEQLWICKEPDRCSMRRSAKKTLLRTEKGAA